MSDKPELPEYDPDDIYTLEDKERTKAYIAQMDIEAHKKEWSQIYEEEWVPFETVLAELRKLNEEKM